MIQGFAYFHAIVYRDEHPEWVDYALKVSQKYFDAQASESVMCQTDHMGNDPDMKFLTNYLLSTGHDILTSQGYDMNRYELYISGLWGQEVKGHGGTNVDVHKNSQLCGWFFLEASEGGSYPVYYDTRVNKQMIELDFLPNDEVTNATSTIHFNNIVPGTVLLANSWMQHQLTPNMTKKPTKSIHFMISHRDKSCSICRRLMLNQLNLLFGGKALLTKKSLTGYKSEPLKLIKERKSVVILMVNVYRKSAVPMCRG